MQAFSQHAIVQIQGPIQIGDLSEPEPDMLLCQLREDFYLDKKPIPSDTYLIVEVSDSTLKYDQEIKLPLYSKSGIPEYWIIDVNENQILKYTHPEGDQYLKKEIISVENSIHCNHFPEIKLNVKDILG